MSGAKKRIITISSDFEKMTDEKIRDLAYDLSYHVIKLAIKYPISILAIDEGNDYFHHLSLICRLHNILIKRRGQQSEYYCSWGNVINSVIVLN